MGIPGGYTDVILPKPLVDFLTLLSFLRRLTLTLFGLIGLSGYITIRPNFQARYEPVMTMTDSATAALIREMLPSERVSVRAEEEEEGFCAVCLYEYEKGEEIRRMRNCSHVFHKGCVDRWIDHDKATCPLCRRSFVPRELEGDFNERLWNVYGIPEVYSYSDVARFL